jgi:hypothetical protein
MRRLTAAEESETRTPMSASVRRASLRSSSMISMSVASRSGTPALTQES